MGIRLIRWPELREKIGGVSRTTIWLWERRGIFPRRIQLGPNSIAWNLTEIEEFLKSRKPSNKKASNQLDIRK